VNETPAAETPSEAVSVEPKAAKKRAVDAPRSNVFNMDPNALTIIGIDTKHTGRGDSGHESGLFHPLYDERAFLPRNPQHVAFAREFGIPFAILATKEGEQSIPLEGRQRVLDLRAANKERIEAGEEPWTVKVDFMRGDASKKTAFMIAANALVTEENPVHLAAKIQSFIDLGNSEEQAAVVAGCTVASIKQKLALLELDTHVQKAVSTGKVTMSAALQLKKEPHDKQRAALKVMLAGDEPAAAVAQVSEPAADGKAPTRKTKKPSKATKPKKAGKNAAKAALGKTVRPGLRLLKRVASSSKLSAVAKAVISWVIGEIDVKAASESCKGLSDAVHDAEA